MNTGVHFNTAVLQQNKSQIDCLTLLLVLELQVIGFIYNPFTDTHLLRAISIIANHEHKTVAQIYIFQEVYLSQSIQLTCPGSFCQDRGIFL